MRKGFTLLELTIVLVIVSLLLSVSFPAILRSSLSSEESFKTRLTTLFSSAFVPGKAVEFCVDFKKNRLTFGGEELQLPYRVNTLVLPGKTVSSELSTLYCLDLKKLAYGAIIMEKGNGYPSILFTFPAGEVLFYNLSEAEEETLKDKVEKGRIVEWFSYYSY